MTSYDNLTTEEKGQLDSVEKVIHILKIYRMFELKQNPPKLKLFVWKHDKYVTSNALGTGNKVESICGAFLLEKAKDTGIPKNMCLFWRPEMTRILERMNAYLAKNECYSVPPFLCGGQGMGKLKLMYVYAMSLADIGHRVLWVNMKRRFDMDKTDLLLLTKTCNQINCKYQKGSKSECCTFEKRVSLAVQVLPEVLLEILKCLTVDNYVFFDGWMKNADQVLVKSVPYCKRIYVSSVETSFQRFDSAKIHEMIGWTRADYAAAFKDEQLKKRLKKVVDDSPRDKKDFDNNFLLSTSESPKLKLSHIESEEKKQELINHYILDPNKKKTFEKTLRELVRRLQQTSLEKETQDLVYTTAALKDEMNNGSLDDRRKLRKEIAKSVAKQEYLQDFDKKMESGKYSYFSFFSVLLYNVKKENPVIADYTDPAYIEEKIADYQEMPINVKANILEAEIHWKLKGIGLDRTLMMALTAQNLNGALEEEEETLHQTILEKMLAVNLYLKKQDKNSRDEKLKELYAFVFLEAYMDFASTMLEKLAKTPTKSMDIDGDTPKETGQENIDTNDENEENTEIDSSEKDDKTKKENISSFGVEKELMRMMYYCQCEKESSKRYSNAFDSRVLKKGLHLIGKKDLKDEFIHNRRFEYKYQYAGSSARYMFDFPCTPSEHETDVGIVCDIKHALQLHVLDEIFNLFMGYQDTNATIKESRLQVPHRFDKDFNPIYEYTSDYVERCVVKRCKDQNIPKFSDLRSAEILGEVLEILFSKLVEDSRMSTKQFELKYLGVYPRVHEEYVEEKICHITVSNMLVDEVPDHEGLINHLAKKDNMWIKTLTNYPGWDVAISCGGNYLLLLQITLNKNKHDISFKQGEQVLTDLTKRDVHIKNLELACLFPDLSIAQDIRLVPKANKNNMNLPGDIKVVHRGFSDQSNIDELSLKTWKDLGNEHGLHGIGMYIPTVNLFAGID